MLLVTVMLCSCSKAVDFFSVEEENVEYVDSNIVYAPIEKVRTLNPAISKDEDMYYISKLVYEGLYSFDENMAVKPQLASSAVFDTEELCHIITLRPGVRWHDGEEFTSQDVKFTIDSLIALGEGTLYSGYVSNISSVRLEKSDRMTLRIYYKSPVGTSLENLTFPILPSHEHKNVSALKSDIENFKMVGTGPYRLKEYNSLSHLTLVGNEGYYGTVPQNELVFQILPSRRDAINLMDVNNISIFFDKGFDRDTFISNKDVGVVNFPSNEVELIGFNLRKPALEKKKVRQALAYAIDAQAILEAVYFKKGILNDSLYYPEYLGTKNEGELYPSDLEKAKVLLTEAGYADIDGDFFVEDKEENEISISILINEDDPSRVAAAQILKASLDKLPIETYIESCSRDVYNSRLSSGDYDIYIGGWQFDDRFDLRALLHSGSGNIAGYKNDRVDKLLEEMQSGAYTGDKKVEVCEKLKGILADEIPYYCLFYKTYGAFTTKALKGDVAPLFNNLYNGSENWSCSYEVEPTK